MNKPFLSVLFLTALALYLGSMAPPVRARTVLTASKVTQMPVIDGRDGDEVWSAAVEIVTHDPIAGIDIGLKAIYTIDEIAFLVRFADPDESRLHKPWIWDPTEKTYRMGPDREDCVVLKWAMDPGTWDLSIFADRPYIADVWFWKADRTDPAGYADDKWQELRGTAVPRAMEITSRSGTSMFLIRRGDHGLSAYQTKLQVAFAGPRIPQFIHRSPVGSREDIRAKGHWSGGRWCVEMARKLNTGHSDDVQFEVSQSYLFGVSRYEIAGRGPDPEISQPLYGAGDVAEKLILRFGIQP